MLDRKSNRNACARGGRPTRRMGFAKHSRSTHQGTVRHGGLRTPTGMPSQNSWVPVTSGSVAITLSMGFLGVGQGQRDHLKRMRLIKAVNIQRDSESPSLLRDKNSASCMSKYYTSR